VRPRRTALLVAALAVAAVGVALGQDGAAPASRDVLTVRPAADTYIDRTRPGANFGTAVRISAQGSRAYARRALLRFAPVTIPAGHSVVSARLRLWVEAGTPPTGGADLYETTGDWTESDVTWASAPPLGARLGRSANLRVDSWAEWDVTRAVPATGTGEVNLQLATDDSGWYGFEASEKPTPNHPRLVVVTRAGDPSGDGTPPDTTISAGPAGTTRSTSAWFSFTSNEPGSTFECRLDGNAYAPCRSPHHYPEVAAGPHDFSVRATDPAGNADASPATRAWTVASPDDDVVVAAVGDMNPPQTTDADSPSGRNGAAIAAALRSGAVDAFFGLGDFQYDVARCADYVNFWRPLWGGTKQGLYWVSAPNHDWQPGRNEDFDDFMNGACPGDATKARVNEERGWIENGEPYSADFGRWHVAFLSSALWRYDRARARRATTWLDEDLAAATAAGRHLAVVYHEPYFTSDTSHHTRAADHKPWIDVMWKYRVRFTLSGSQHNYERSCPVDAADACVPDGMIAFQVSTGGIGLRPFESRPPYIAARFSDTHGWLQLTLHADGSFDWRFNPVDGSSTDAGHRPA